MCHTTPPLPEIRLWAQLSLDPARSFNNANSDYDAGENTDFEYASSDIDNNANSDYDHDGKRRLPRRK